LLQSPSLTEIQYGRRLGGKFLPLVKRLVKPVRVPLAQPMFFIREDFELSEPSPRLSDVPEDDDAVMTDFTKFLGHNIFKSINFGEFDNHFQSFNFSFNFLTTRIVF
jgi:hypothetical protein